MLPKKLKIGVLVNNTQKLQYPWILWKSCAWFLFVPFHLLNTTIIPWAKFLVAAIFYVLCFFPITVKVWHEGLKNISSYCWNMFLYSFNLNLISFQKAEKVKRFNLPVLIPSKTLCLTTFFVLNISQYMEMALQPIGWSASFPKIHYRIFLKISEFKD